MNLLDTVQQSSIIKSDAALVHVAEESKCNRELHSGEGPCQLGCSATSATHKDYPVSDLRPWRRAQAHKMWNNSTPRAFIVDISGATTTFNGRRRLLKTWTVRSTTGFAQHHCQTTYQCSVGANVPPLTSRQCSSLPGRVLQSVEKSWYFPA